jgi:hypothetical protein
MTAKLTISPELKLPAEAVTQTFGIVAKRGVGKTNTSVVITEEMLRAGHQVVIADPVGVWWGLRAAANGKDPGLPIIVMGGDHGDVPLELAAGGLVADFIVDSRQSVLLDLARFRKGEQVRFMTDFCERLYHRNREPLHLVLDEADAFAPQKPFKGQERLLGAVEDLVRRGRARGLGITLITQRSAVINKNVLSQVEVLIAMRTIGPQDRAAIEAWIEVHGTEEQKAELLASLPSLPIGTAWFWSPGWLDIFKKVQVRKRDTFDSSATPKVGERPRAPKKMAAVDLEQLKVRIAATIEKQKAEDPRELKKRVAELEAQLKKAAAAKPAPAPKEKRVEVPVPLVTDKQLARMEQVVARAEKVKAKLESFSESLEAGLDDVINLCKEVHDGVQAAKQRFAIPVPVLVERRPFPAPPSRPQARSPRPSSSGPGEDLPKGERVVLIAVAQYPDGVTREQLTVLTGYKRSSRDTYLQRLRERGHVEPTGDVIRATDAGVAALGDFEPLPTGDALLLHWLGRLPEGERRVLEVVVGAYPKAVDRDKISDVTDYKRSSRDTYLQRLGARKLITTEGRGGVRAAEELFS